MRLPCEFFILNAFGVESFYPVRRMGTYAITDAGVDAALHTAGVRLRQHQIHRRRE
ncbi:MAG: hypothetical protein IPO77_10310 [Acidobacteria bacterium]|nr:hypothetical protein [Acidobacteriota bacterium]